MKCMKRKRIRTLTKCLEKDLGQKSLGCEDLSESEEFGLREREREISIQKESEKWNLNRASHLNKNLSLMDWSFYSRICRALNLDRSETVEVLSRICRWQKEGLDVSRIYQPDKEQRKLARWIEEAVELLSRWNLEISLDWETVEILSRNDPKISMDRRSVKILSRRQRAQEKFLDGSKICRSFYRD